MSLLENLVKNDVTWGAPSTRTTRSSIRYLGGPLGASMLIAARAKETNAQTVHSKGSGGNSLKIMVDNKFTQSKNVSSQRIYPERQ